MTAGYNARVSIYARDAAPDDAIGGAVITGSYAYVDVPCRVESVAALETQFVQGYETSAQYDVILSTNYVVREGDYLIVENSGHPLYDLPLRVIGVQYDSALDNRRHQEVRTVRMRRAVRSP